MSLSVQWFPLLPVPFILLLAAALLAVLTCGSWLLRGKSVPRRWVLVLGGLRLGMVVLFTVAMLRPVVALPHTVPLSPEALVLVDVSASMAQPSAKGSRLDEVRGVLQTSPAIAAAGRSHRLHWFTFDRRAKPLASAADLEGLKPQGDSTDFASSLEMAVQRVRLSNAAIGRDGAPARVLIVSDGLDQGTKDGVALAKRLGLTVDVLSPSQATGEKRPPEVTIADVQAARRVLIGSETSLQVTVRAGTAIPGVSMVLQEDGREVERRELGALAAGQESRAILVHRPAEPGLKRYTVGLLGNGKPLGRSRTVNVQVTDRRHDVLLLEDSWRWDFKYLKRVFEDDPSFSFTALLARGSGVYVQFGEPERRVQLAGFPHSRAELDGFETIVLGNVNPATWPRGLARSLSQAVSDGGKSLVVIAGPNLSKWADMAELTRLLPVEITRESGQPISGRMELRLTPEGAATTWFSPAGARTTKPPPLTPLDDVYPVVRKRPAATVLIESAGQSNAYGPLIVMAEHTFGRGRVLFIATDTLWQWQTLGARDEKGVTAYATFWQQALRAMAPPEPTSSPVQLWLRPARTAYRTRERVSLSAELASRQELTRKGASAVEFVAAVVLPDGRRLPLDLTADPRNPSRRVASFDVLTAGAYRIEATARGESQTLAESSTVIEVQARPPETTPAPVDVAGLARLASGTGGRIVDPQSSDGWLKAEAVPQVTTVEKRTIDLWQNFSLLLGLCGLMAADWSLRLFRGFV